MILIFKLCGLSALPPSPIPLHNQPMPTIDTIIDLLEHVAPHVLAESWDNVGLLVGDRTREVKRLMKESDIVTYAVGILGGSDMSSSLGMMGQSFLDELTSVTGGRSFYPAGDAELDEIFERIALELRHQYSVGYTPPNFTPDGKWHKVKVKVKPPRGLPRLTVRSREGYYATPFSELD